MNFEYSDKVAGLIAQIEAFMDEHVYPNEQAYYDFVHDQNNRWQEWPGMEALKDKARAQGLWNLFLPSSSGLTNAQYGVIAEETGRCLLAPEVFNCSAPDTGNMEVRRGLHSVRCARGALHSLTRYYPLLHWLTRRNSTATRRHVCSPYHEMGLPSLPRLKVRPPRPTSLPAASPQVLHEFGTDAQKATWLEPLLARVIRSCFAMTEPGVASSDATNMASTIRQAGSPRRA